MKIQYAISKNDYKQFKKELLAVNENIKIDNKDEYHWTDFWNVYIDTKYVNTPDLRKVNEFIASKNLEKI